MRAEPQGEKRRETLTRWSVPAGLLLLLILTPFFLWEESIRVWSRGLLEARSPRWVTGGVLAALLAGDLVLPIPSSILSTAAGSLLGLWLGAFVTWAGMTAGCWIGYRLGAGPGRKAAWRLAGEEEMTRLARLHARMGDWIVVVLRAVPVLAEASVVFAGVAGMSERRFFLMTGLSNAGIAMTYAAIGAFAMRMESFLPALAGAIGLPGLVMAALWLCRRFQTTRRPTAG